MPFTKEPNAEPIPGYRLIAPLGCGGFGEVWKCEAPGGLLKAIKFVYGNLDSVGGQASQAYEELQAIQHIKDLRHPFLLAMDRVEIVSGELMIVSELADQNLAEVLRGYQDKGLAGIPRDELLRYLAEAAEVLDLMNAKHGLQHLDVKPRNFFLVSNHVKVADFGLVTSLSKSGGGIKLGAVTPLYASPEVFQGNVSRFSDQYSLACCYVELLTGLTPFAARNSRQLLLLHLNAEPDLSLLSEADRVIVAQALAKAPEQRHPSCLEFIHHLIGTEPPRWAAVDLRAQPCPASGLATPTEVRNEALTQTPQGERPAEHGSHTASKGFPPLPPGLAGYQVIEGIFSSPIVDIWKIAAPDGRLREVKFIYGVKCHAEDTVKRLQAIQHPALPQWEIVQSSSGCLVLVQDQAKETMRDRWHKCQSHKLPGIPRLELLGYLRTTAEVVDYVYQQHSIYHLTLNPRLLLLADGGLQVDDFGLAHQLWLPAGQFIGRHNARYAAPELFQSQARRSSDQYSLAIIYQELLTGSHPFGDRLRKARGSARANLKPDLDALPETERAAIVKALDPDPQMRWQSCGDLIRALEGSQRDDTASLGRDDALHEIITSPSQPPHPPGSSSAGQELEQLLRDVIADAGGTVPTADPFSVPSFSESGDELTHKFRVGLPVGAALIRVDAYRLQCNARLVREDERRYDFLVPAPANFWQQLTGNQPGLEINVRLTRPHAQSATPIDVLVRIKAVGFRKKNAAAVVQDLGANLLEGLRSFLLVNSEKRTNDRLLWPHPVEIRAIDEDGSSGPAVICRGKDISLGGIGFYLPHELPTAQVLIRLPNAPHSGKLTIPATLVRAQRCADGWYDVGALFRLVALRKSKQIALGSSEMAAST